MSLIWCLFAVPSRLCNGLRLTDLSPCVWPRRRLSSHWCIHQLSTSHSVPRPRHNSIKPPTLACGCNIDFRLRARALWAIFFFFVWGFSALCEHPAGLWIKLLSRFVYTNHKPKIIFEIPSILLCVILSCQRFTGSMCGSQCSRAL